MRRTAERSLEVNISKRILPWGVGGWVLGAAVGGLASKGYLPGFLDYFNHDFRLMGDSVVGLGVLTLSTNTINRKEVRSGLFGLPARRVAAAMAIGGLLAGGLLNAAYDTNVGRATMSSSQPRIKAKSGIHPHIVRDALSGALATGVWAGGFTQGWQQARMKTTAEGGIDQMEDALAAAAANGSGQLPMPGEPLPGPDGDLPPEFPEGFGGPEELPRPEN